MSGQFTSLGNKLGLVIVNGLIEGHITLSFREKNDSCAIEIKYNKIWIWFTRFISFIFWHKLKHQQQDTSLPCKEDKLGIVSEVIACSLEMCC